MVEVKGLRGGDFREEILPRPLTSTKPERTGKKQIFGSRGSVRGELPHLYPQGYPCGYRREQNKVKNPKNPVISRLFGFLLELIFQLI